MLTAGQAPCSRGNTFQQEQGSDRVVNGMVAPLVLESARVLYSSACAAC